MRTASRRFIVDRELVGGVLYLFDLIYLDDYDLRELPWRTRKTLLQAVFRFDDRVRFVAHREQYGVRYPGRSRDWLKLKCTCRQELVIGGFTDPERSRTEQACLLAGMCEVLSTAAERGAQESERSE